LIYRDATAELVATAKDFKHAFGGKSANLGEVMYAKLPGIVVPNGFAIPFYYYDEFIGRNNR
jgi:phosphoenolpyruvate synthase/pyruvate phosphate dikinase